MERIGHPTGRRKGAPRETGRRPAGTGAGACGDSALTRFTMRGTHEGESMDVPASGKEVTRAGMGLERVEDGELVETWVQRNDPGLMQQPEMVPAS